jgi:Tol biopolymer transport system component
MKSEQARGVKVDKRADIWAFGVVLFEMLSGREMFSGETISDTLAAVLRADFPWSVLPAETPAPIRRLLVRTLERDRKKRLADIADARLEIDEALAGPAPQETVAAPVAAPRSRILPWAVAGVLAAVALALAVLHFRESTPEQRVLKYTIPPPPDVAFVTVVPSPDGRRLAFTGSESGGTRLWVQPLDSLTAQPLAGTDGAANPFWSPDSRYLGFFTDGKLKKIDSSGGPPQTLCEASGGRGGSWSPEGVILFGNVGTPLQRVAAEGGEAKAIVGNGPIARAGSPRWPTFLPDGRHFLYADRGDKPEEAGIFVAALDTNDRKRLLRDYSAAAYTESASGAGYLLFSRGGTLMAQLFDASKLSLSGGPFPVAEHVTASVTSGFAPFWLSRKGTLVLGTGNAPLDRKLTWFDRTGKRLGSVGETGSYIQIDLSPDEKQAVVDRYAQAGTSDLWLIDLTRNVPTRFTFGPMSAVGPVWSKDGSQIAFASGRGGPYELYRKIASGAGKDELLLKSADIVRPSDWSPDGRFLLYEEVNQKTGYDLMLLPDRGGSQTDRKPIPFLQTEFQESHGAFSPDGKWIAYCSNESGKLEVYVQPFPANGAKWQISKGGGDSPKWRHDGKEIFFLDAANKLMAVEVKTDATIQPGTPRALFDAYRARFAVTRDGQRFLIPARPTEGAGPEPVTVMINWTAGIKH